MASKRKPPKKPSNIWAPTRLGEPVTHKNEPKRHVIPREDKDLCVFELGRKLGGEYNSPPNYDKLLTFLESLGIKVKNKMSVVKAADANRTIIAAFATKERSATPTTSHGTYAVGISAGMAVPPHGFREERRHKPELQQEFPGAKDLGKKHKYRIGEVPRLVQGQKPTALMLSFSKTARRGAAVTSGDWTTTVKFASRQKNIQKTNAGRGRQLNIKFYHSSDKSGGNLRCVVMFKTPAGARAAKQRIEQFQDQRQRHAAVLSIIPTDRRSADPRLKSRADVLIARQERIERLARKREAAEILKTTRISAREAQETLNEQRSKVSTWLRSQKDQRLILQKAQFASSIDELIKGANVTVDISNIAGAAGTETELHPQEAYEYLRGSGIEVSNIIGDARAVLSSETAKREITNKDLETAFEILNKPQRNIALKDALFVCALMSYDGKKYDRQKFAEIVSALFVDADVAKQFVDKNSIEEHLRNLEGTTFAKKVNLHRYEALLTSKEEQEEHYFNELASLWAANGASDEWIDEKISQIKTAKSTQADRIYQHQNAVKDAKKYRLSLKERQELEKGLDADVKVLIKAHDLGLTEDDFVNLIPPKSLLRERRRQEVLNMLKVYNDARIASQSVGTLTKEELELIGKSGFSGASQKIKNKILDLDYLSPDQIKDLNKQELSSTDKAEQRAYNKALSKLRLTDADIHDLNKGLDKANPSTVAKAKQLGISDDDLKNLSLPKYTPEEFETNLTNEIIKTAEDTAAKRLAEIKQAEEEVAAAEEEVRIHRDMIEQLGSEVPLDNEELASIEAYANTIEDVPVQELGEDVTNQELAEMETPELLEPVEREEELETLPEKYPITTSSENRGARRAEVRELNIALNDILSHYGIERVLYQNKEQLPYDANAKAFFGPEHELVNLPDTTVLTNYAADHNLSTEKLGTTYKTWLDNTMRMLDSARDQAKDVINDQAKKIKGEKYWSGVESFLSNELRLKAVGNEVFYDGKLIDVRDLDRLQKYVDELDLQVAKDQTKRSAASQKIAGYVRSVTGKEATPTGINKLLRLIKRWFGDVRIRQNVEEQQWKVLRMRTSEKPGENK